MQNNIDFIFISSGRKAGGETEVGLTLVGQVAEGHCAGVPRRLCPVNHRKETCNVRSLKSRSKGKDAAHRLPQTSRQGTELNYVL
jgi:hypothetical protein